MLPGWLSLGSSFPDLIEISMLTERVALPNSLPSLCNARAHERAPLPDLKVLLVYAEVLDKPHPPINILDESLSWVFTQSFIKR